MRILIINQNNDKLKFKQVFLLQSGIKPLSFLPTSGLFCKDATHMLISNDKKILKIMFYYFDSCEKMAV